MATDDFLLGSAYAAGEFERLQRRFDSAVVELAACLAEPVERAMRTAMTQELAALLPAQAGAIESFLRSGDEASAVVDPPEKQAEMARLHQALRGLGQSLELDAQTVAEEVDGCAGELAHHTLALWFATLRRALRRGAGEALNANMLPGDMSMQQVLHELDVEAFGVKIETVILALSRYRSALRARALQSGQLITFADDLLIAVGRDDARRPYTLYAAQADHVRDLARAARVASRPPVEAVRAHLVNLARRIDMAVGAHAAPAVRYERLIDAALADPEGGRFRVGDMRVTLPSSMHRAAPAVAEFAVADDLFAYPIEAGADAVAAGASGQAMARLNQRLPRITSQLNEYAQVRSIPFEKVCTAYAVLVATRAEPMAVDVQIWNHGAGAAVPAVFEEQFAQALDLPVDLSATMIYDAGAATAEGGLFEAGSPLSSERGSATLLDPWGRK